MPSKSPPIISKILPKHKAFINEYLIDCNGSRAARTLGYSNKSARVVATNWLKSPLIQGEIARLQRNQLELLGCSPAYILETIREIIEANRGADVGPARHQVALRGCELAGKHHGLWDSGNGDRSRRPHELSDKELIALGMELQKGKEGKEIKPSKPQIIEAEIVTKEERT